MLCQFQVYSKRFSYTGASIRSFTDAFPGRVPAECWAEVPVRHSGTLLATPPFCVQCVDVSIRPLFYPSQSFPFGNRKCGFRVFESVCVWWTRIPHLSVSDPTSPRCRRCLSFSEWPHSVGASLAPPTRGIVSCFVTADVPLWRRHLFFLPSSVHGPLGDFHVLAAGNSAAVNNGMHISFMEFYF